MLVGTRPAHSERRRATAAFRHADTNRDGSPSGAAIAIGSFFRCFERIAPTSTTTSEGTDVAQGASWRITMHLLIFLVFGLIVGALARLIVPGKEPGGWIISMALGVLGSFLGTFLGRGLGWYQDGEPAGFLMSLVGAIILVAGYHAITRGRRGALA
ncbi:MAG: GlsB/YeaQ/YmgE family stress response membrane protein [Polyangiaceae bacterium]